MSYCRPGPDCDFYVYTDGARIHVYGDNSDDHYSFPVGAEQQLIDFLRAAQAEGRKVPEGVFQRLTAERWRDSMSDDDIGTVRWFGESWGAPICDPRAHVDTPVGQDCAGHDHLHGPVSRKIREGDQGVTVPFFSAKAPGILAYHLQCWFHELGLHP